MLGTTVKTLTRQQKFALYAAAIPMDLEKLWNPLGDGPHDEDAPVNRLAKKWNEFRGKRLVLPKELVTEVSKELDPRGRPARYVGSFCQTRLFVKIEQ